MIEGPRPPHEQMTPPADLAQYTAQLFGEVSRTFPAAEVPQAATIALRSRDIGVTPLAMHRSFSDRPELADKLADAANKMHARTGNTMSRHISGGEITAVTRVIFGIAEAIDQRMLLPEIHALIADHQARRELGRQAINSQAFWLRDYLGVQVRYRNQG